MVVNLRKLSKNSECENLNIRTKRGSPYHPQNQGKVERSHRSLRKKIMFDLLQLSKKGVNWVSSLQEYQKLLNEDSKDVLGKQSPFEVFYGRASNAICNFVKKEKVSFERVGSSPIAPHKSDLTSRRQQVKRIRQRAKKANDVWDVRYIKRRVKNNPPSMYGVGERVLLRFPINKKGRIAPKNRYVLEATVIRRKPHIGKYFLRYISPTTDTQKEEWVLVEDITSRTASEEIRQRNKLKSAWKLTNQQRKNTGANILFQWNRWTIWNRSEISDGNCQFSAISYFLRDIGIWRSHETLREEVVRYLSGNPNTVDGTPIEMFVGMPWHSWDGTYSDHVTLQVIANIYNIEIRIISTLGEEAMVLISPQYSSPIAYFTLGHFAENEGIHYVCLSGSQFVAKNGQDDNDGKYHTFERQRDSDDNDIHLNQVNDSSSPLLESNSGQEHAREGLEGNNQQDLKENEGNNVHEPTRESQEVNNEHEPTDEGQEDNRKEHEPTHEGQEDNNEEHEPTHEGQEDNGGYEHQQEDCDGHTDAIQNFVERLPQELLEIIIDFALTGTTRDIVQSYNALSHVNRLFRSRTTNFLSRLPMVHCHCESMFLDSYYSLRKISRENGRGSGIVMRLKEVINSPWWFNAWVRLLYSDTHGWFIIRNIVWKHQKKH